MSPSEIPVVELLRVSGASQAGEGALNLPAQHAVNERTAAQYGLRIVETVEVVVSGTEIAQTAEMGRVLDCIMSGRAQGVLLAEYSRLFRPERYTDIPVLQVFHDYHAQIYIPAGPIDLTSDFGHMQASILTLFASMERRTLTARLRRGKEEHRREGRHVAGGVGLPFGLQYSTKEGWRWTEDAVLVRELFRRFLAGERRYEVLARELGIPRSTTRYLLANPVYTGVRVYDRQKDLSPRGRAPSGHRRTIRRPPEDVIRVRLPLEPLVSEEDFQLVQEIIAAKAGRIVRPDASGEYLYRGLLSCGLEACGLVMYTHLGSRGQRFYCCVSHKAARRPAGAEPCSTGYVLRDKIEVQLDEVIAARLTDPDLLAAAVSAYGRSLEAAWRTARVEPADLEERLNTLHRKRKRVIDAFVEGAMEREERDVRLAPILDEIRTVEHLQAHTRAPDPGRLTDGVVVQLLSAFAEWVHLDRGGRRRILEAIEPTFYVVRTGRKEHAVAGVRFPWASLAADGDTVGSLRTAGVVTTTAARGGYQLTDGGLYVPLCA